MHDVPDNEAEHYCCYQIISTAPDALSLPAPHLDCHRKTFASPLDDAAWPGNRLRMTTFVVGFVGEIKRADDGSLQHPKETLTHFIT